MYKYVPSVQLVMVFENVTLVELHLENSRFNAPGSGASEEEEASVEVEIEEESGGGGMGRALGVLVFLAIVGFAVRRFRSGGDGGEEVGVEEAEGISIEQAAE